jgi:hypothetical protein
MPMPDDDRVRGDTKDIGLWYPRYNEVKYVEVDLVDVRAADGIRISYDFERDGWKIEQASTFSWEADDPVCDPDWQEVAFVQAWARKRPGPGDDDYELPVQDNVSRNRSQENERDAPGRHATDTEPGKGE